MHRTPHSPRRGFIRTALGLGGGAALLNAPALRAAEPAAVSRTLDVRAFGAKGDGASLDTGALQAAIDTCARTGGAVQFPPGRYLAGTLLLRSHVALCLESGATLLGSPRLEDYPSTVSKVRSYTDNYTERSLLYGEDLEDVALLGRGVIDGQGAAFPGPYKVRPYLIRFVACKNVAVRDLAILDSPMWVQHYLACDDVFLEGLRIRSRCNSNNDGIDIDGCTGVRIANCDISSGDDAIVLKSTLDRPCRQVAIANCLLSSACSAFKLGTESNGGFADIALSNCVLYDTRLAGIALELVDGGRLERVAISNVTMRQVRGPIFVRLGNRARPFQAGGDKPPQGSLQQVSISHIRAVGADRTGCSITGLPGAPARDVALEDVDIAFAGGGLPEDARRAVPENADKYPEYSMFGPLPAYGFYCRHVEGLRLRQVRVRCVQPEARPGLVCDDVEDLELAGWRGTPPAGGEPAIRFHDVRQALVHGCVHPAGAGRFLRATGGRSGGIRLLANDLPDSPEALERGEDLPASALRLG